MSQSTRLPSLRRVCERGVAAVEFAIVLVPLLTLAFGVTELGRAAYQYNTVTKGVRDAARYLTTVSPGTHSLEAACLVVTGSPSNTGGSCDEAALVSGLTISMVSICDRVSCATTHKNQTTGRGVVDLVTVSVAGLPFSPVVSFVVDAFDFGAISSTFATKV